MSARDYAVTSIRQRHAALDPVGAACSVAAIGCGAVLAISGAASEQDSLIVAGAVALAIGTTILLAGGWIELLPFLLVSLPLPALYNTDALRISPAALTSALVLFAWMLVRGRQIRPIAFGAMPLRALAIFMGALLLSAAVAQDRGAAARELINFVLILGVLIISIDELRSQPERIQKLVLGLAVLVAICGALAMLETIGFLPGRFPLQNTSLQRAALGMPSPNALGMFLGMGLPFVGYAISTARTADQRMFFTLALGAAIAGLIATFSRGSWLAVLGGTLPLLWTGERRFVLRVWLTAFSAGLFIDVVTGGAVSSRLTSTIGDWVLEQRLALAWAGILMFRAHPVFGVGPGGFAESLEEFGPQITWLWDYLPTAQNGYVQMAAEVGTVGLLALLALLMTCWLTLLREAQQARQQATLNTLDLKLRQAALWSFSAACLITFSEWPFAHGVGQLMMIVCALGFALRTTRAVST